MKRLLLLGMALVLAVGLAGCNGDDDVVFVATGPGFVGIDDSTEGREPALTVTYIDPVTLLPVTVSTLSDPALDGDIAFVPPNNFTVATSPTTLFFGIDSSDLNEPEFRAFLTFPLQGIVPSGAAITNATVELFITEVSFAGVVPAFLDLVPYGVLGDEDFEAAFLDFGELEFFSSHAGKFVEIPVTFLMDTAQALDLLDFQIRFSIDSVALRAGAQPARPKSELKKADMTVSPSSKTPNRPTRTPSADRPARSR